ncbi:hypothetical protein DSO57_1012395 [Entomophthora muscae]|uniref:Uncharacterized protein n=1 Tax=Entomophthora muscae TaxID=34485 RepID=A0ACC2UFC1_9FUNG|nr:hypothetical protein DSO57_1012395 [Entomophthora muscae]
MEKIEALSITAPPETKEQQRHRLYCQSILLAIEATQLPSLETTYQSPPLLKLKLNCELKPNSVLRQIACDVAQVSQQLQHAQTTVISLCRNLEITPQKPTQHQPLEPLSSSFISLCKDGAKWILSELKQASRIDLEALLGIVMCPPAIPLHTAAQFPAPWTHAQVVPSSLLAIHRPVILEVSGPLAWHKTPDWVFPLILELRTQGRLNQQLYDSLRHQACSHEGTWEASLRSWGSESLIALDASGLCDFAPSLNSIVCQAEASWALKPQLHLATLHQANNTDIPQTHKLHQEIKDILCERDKLLNTFDF